MNTNKEVENQKSFRTLSCLFVIVLASLLSGCDSKEFTELNNAKFVQRNDSPDARIDEQSRQNRAKCEPKLYEDFGETEKEKQCFGLQNELSMAAWNGDVEKIEALISKGANVNGRSSPNSEAPLFLAITKERVRAVQLLLKNGADTNRVEMFGSTPLKVATLKNNKEIVELLVLAGAEICLDPMDDELRRLNALDIAIQNGFSEIVDYLENHGAGCS